MLDRTAQTWKIRVTACALLLLAFLLVSERPRVLRHSNALEIGWKLVAVFACCSWILWAVRTIRCPNCGARLLLRAIRDQPLLKWLNWLLSLDSCPVCGYEGDDERWRRDRPRPGRAPHANSRHAKLVAVGGGVIAAVCGASLAMLSEMMVLRLVTGRALHELKEPEVLVLELAAWAFGGFMGGLFAAQGVPDDVRTQVSWLVGGLLAGIACIHWTSFLPTWAILLGATVSLVTPVVGGRTARSRFRRFSDTKMGVRSKR